MIHLMELELRKVNIRPYIYVGFAAILCMVGLLYTFAMIAHVGGDSDAAEFSTYYNIWVLVNALQTAAYSILMAVMFSTFLLKDYTGKNAVLVFSYPTERKKLLQCKIALVSLFIVAFMIGGTILMYAIFTLSEAVFPLVPDQPSIGLFIRVLGDTVLCMFITFCIGLISVRVGFSKKSVQITIVTSVIICCCVANVIATMSYSYIPVCLLFIVAVFLALISYKGVRAAVDDAEV